MIALNLQNGLLSDTYSGDIHKYNRDLNTVSPQPAFFSTWMANPDKYDWPGVDLPRGGSFTGTEYYDTKARRGIVTKRKGLSSAHTKLRKKRRKRAATKRKIYRKVSRRITRGVRKRYAKPGSKAYKKAYSRWRSEKIKRGTWRSRKVGFKSVNARRKK